MAPPVHDTPPLTGSSLSVAVVDPAAAVALAVLIRRTAASQSGG